MNGKFPFHGLIVSNGVHNLLHGLNLLIRLSFLVEHTGMFMGNNDCTESVLKCNLASIFSSDSGPAYGKFVYICFSCVV